MFANILVFANRFSRHVCKYEDFPSFSCLQKITGNRFANMYDEFADSSFFIRHVCKHAAELLALLGKSSVLSLASFDVGLQMCCDMFANMSSHVCKHVTTCLQTCTAEVKVKQKNAEVKVTPKTFRVSKTL